MSAGSRRGQSGRLIFRVRWAFRSFSAQPTHRKPAASNPRSSPPAPEKSDRYVGAWLISSTGVRYLEELATVYSGGGRLGPGGPSAHASKGPCDPGSTRVRVRSPPRGHARSSEEEVVVHPRHPALRLPPRQRCAQQSCADWTRRVRSRLPLWSCRASPFGRIGRNVRLVSP